MEPLNGVPRRGITMTTYGSIVWAAAASTDSTTSTRRLWPGPLHCALYEFLGGYFLRLRR